MKHTNLFLLLLFFLTSCAVPGAPIATQTSTPAPTATQTLTPAPMATPTLKPESTDDCALNVAVFGGSGYATTKIGGKALYDLEGTEPNDLYLEVEATVIESQHLVVPDYEISGTLVYSYITDTDKNGTKTGYGLLIYLPDNGVAVDSIIKDTTINASGLYLGFYTPSANFFKSYPNEKEDKWLPMIRADFASYGCY